MAQQNATIGEAEAAADIAAALALGQSAELMRGIEAGNIHPAMAAFGLWSDETELETLSDEIYANRRRQTYFHKDVQDGQDR